MKPIHSFTYLNSRTGTFSVQSRKGWSRGLVIYTPSIVEITGVTFKVSKAGRERVLRDGVKNVHAGLVGLAKPSMKERPNLRGYKQIRYNPYEADYFMTVESNKPVVACSKAILMDRTIYAKGLRYGTE